MVIKLNVRSNDITALVNFIKYIKSFYKFYHLNYSFSNISSTPSKRKLFSILKSPHVNKIAQEQFEIKTYSRKFIIRTNNYLKFLLLLKKLNTSSFFSNLNISFTLFIKKKNIKLKIIFI